MDKIILDISSVSKVYDSKIEVLKNINLKFKEGKFYALLGENGAGKSTLMRLLAQNEQPSDGEIFYNGQSLSLDTNPLNEDCVYVDESNYFSVNRTVNQWAEIIKNTSKFYEIATFKDLCEKLNLDPQKSFQSLSRGQKSKALFALGAPKKPKIYFLDEITAVLDIGSRFTLINFLETEIKERNCTVVMSTNIATELPSINTHICFLKNGNLELDCHFSELKNIFKKYLTTNNNEELTILDKGGRLISFNNDASKSYIIPESLKLGLETLKEDQRQITIAEIMTYYTTTGK